MYNTRTHTHTHTLTTNTTQHNTSSCGQPCNQGEVSRETHHLTATQDLSTHLGQFLPSCRFCRRARRSMSWTTVASPRPRAPCAWPTWLARSTSCRSPRPPSVCWREVSWLCNNDTDDHMAYVLFCVCILYIVSCHNYKYYVCET